MRKASWPPSVTFVLPLPATGIVKRDLIEMAYEYCGQAGFDFELTPQEVSSTMRLLNAMMAETPFSSMGFNLIFPGLPEDASGLANIDIQVVTTSLALRRAPGMGKTMTPEARYAFASAMNSASSRYASDPPAMKLARNTPRGSGNKRQWYNPFINQTSDDTVEIVDNA